MFKFKTAGQEVRRHKIKFKKARSPRETLNDLDEYIRAQGTEPVEWLAREVRRWGEFSYEEIEQAILDGRLDELIDWQSRYADLINSTLSAQWASAMKAAAAKATHGQIVLYDSDPDVHNWLKRRGGELITVLSEESKRAVANVILYGQNGLVNPKQIARQVRPLIGLNARQAQANINYRERIYQQYISNGVNPVTAAEKADAAAVKYAGKQHRFRAETITHTEMAFAYNQGADVGVKRAVKQGLMGKCEMVWTTAGTNRVCPRCLALKDTVVGHTDESGVTLPPLHPRCRCAIMYREIEAPVAEKPKPSSNIRGLVKPLTPKQIEEIKDAEEKAFNAKTGLDFGFKKMKNPPDWAKEIVLTNPLDKNYGRTPNCQRCVVAHEARMRGYDVIARPSWGDNDTLRNSGEWVQSFEHLNSDFIKCLGKNAEEVIEYIEKKMRSFGEGSRAIVLFKWNKSYVKSNDGHVIVTECRDRGIVNFGDPQTGKISASRLLNLADLEGNIALLRIDNLKFTDTVKCCCKNKE